MPCPVISQTAIDTFTVLTGGDTVRFWMQLPPSYNPNQPPAMMVWWHGLGGAHTELANLTSFDTESANRGWLCACHFGPHDRHWNAQLAQDHCRAMLEWINLRYPFARDSLYMAGSSMGGAAPQIWHNHNCGSLDPFFIAAAAGGSPILDCDLRARQYLAINDTNRSMRMIFGGLPGESDSVSFEYHRYSAVFFEDPVNSMYQNSLTLPQYITWGSSKVEWVAYGHPAREYSSLRDSLLGTTHDFPSGLDGHGYVIMNASEVCDWLSQYSAVREPASISISADETGQYFWTEATVSHSFEFGRYEAQRAPGKSLLRVRVFSNVTDVAVDVSPFAGTDTLRVDCRNLDSQITSSTLTLYPMAGVIRVEDTAGNSVDWYFDQVSRRLTLSLSPDSLYLVIGTVADFTSDPPHSIPNSIQLVSVFPNPFNSTLGVELSSGFAQQTQLHVFDILGRECFSRPIAVLPGSNFVRVDANSWASGAYFLRIDQAPAQLRHVILIR